MTEAWNGSLGEALEKAENGSLAAEVADGDQETREFLRKVVQGWMFRPHCLGRSL